MANDGCGNIINCGSTCPPNEVCGGNNMTNKCGPGICNPKTCMQLGVTCGTTGDGCSGTVNCGACAANATCMNGQCVVNCTPKTCGQQNFNCGAATDGCGTVIDCGTCSGNQTCGAGGPNLCGTSGTCAGLCLKQQTCPMMGQTTTITGTVYAPNGTDPLPDTLVYVPNGMQGAPSWGLQPFQDGVATPHCNCGDDVSGNPLVSAVTDYKGNFTISNMPVGTSIPLVIQNGRWRRLYTIPNVAACTNTALPTSGPTQLRMPRVESEFTAYDNIPRMGFVTGAVDTLECVLRKIGIADSQFSNPSGNGRVRIYLADPSTAGQGAPYNASTPDETTLWGTQAAINQYDLVFFACQGAEYDKLANQQQVVINYANAGGRVFTTHYGYVWLFNDTPFSTTAQWNVDQFPFFTSDPETGYIVTSFAKGMTLAQWLQYIGASPTFGQMQVATLRDDFTAINPPSQLWVYLNDPSYPPMKPMHYTFDTPVGVPAAQQCGKVLYDDFHVEDAECDGISCPNNGQACLGLTQNECTNQYQFPTECSNGPMTPQEKMLEFMIFDLGGCIAPPVCKPATCASQGVQCGPAPDGCGNIIMCPGCPSGQTCIAGKCTMGCTPLSCATQGFMCGMQGDGCGNVQNCGTCPSGTCGGGGMPGQCGNGGCVMKTCAQQNYMCGAVGDGCGNIINCGVCPVGEICGGKTPGQCYKPPCTGKTCAQLGYNCGKATDGCGNIIDCGMCVAPQTCGGGTPPVANVCGGGAN
jgi:hypothetical protein